MLTIYLDLPERTLLLLGTAGLSALTKAYGTSFTLLKDSRSLFLGFFHS